MTKNLPAILVETERMVTEASAWVAQVLPTMGKNYSRERLETLLLQGLREGVLTLTIKAVEAAEKDGDEIADAALRLVFAEMAGVMPAQREAGHLQVWSYGQRAVLRPPNRRPRGKRWYDNWIRDLDICFLIARASAQFNLFPARNREARRANRNPSGISIIVAALARNGLHLEEDTVQRDIWFGLMGELAHRAMAEGPVWGPSSSV